MQPGGPGQSRTGVGAGSGRQDPRSPFGSPGNREPLEELDTSAKFIPGGMVGVSSKNTDASIKIFKGQDHYNDWVVTIQDAMPQFRAPGQQQNQPGMPPNQRGRPNPQGMPSPNPQGTSPNRSGFPNRR